MRYTVALVVTVMSVVVMLVAATSSSAPIRPEQQPKPEAKLAVWQKNKCAHGYSRKSAKRGVVSVMTSRRRLTRARGRQAWKFVHCTKTMRSYRKVRNVLVSLRTWRRTVGRFVIMFKRFSLSVRNHLASIANCESHGDPQAIGGGGLYRGKYQFDMQTWGSVGGRGDPADAPEAEQDYRAAVLLTTSGAGRWPVCG